MCRKRLALRLPLLAFAALFVLPSVSSASPVLTSPLGTPATVGTKFKSTTIGSTVFTTALGNLECTKGLNTGTLLKNTGTEIEGEIESLEITGDGPGGACTSSFLGNFTVTTKVTNGVPYCMKAGGKLPSDTLELRGGSCSGASRPMAFTMDTSSVGSCTYERKSPVTATFTTAPEDATATATGVELVKVSGSGFCPGSAKLDTSLTLEKVSEKAEPAYVS